MTLFHDPEQQKGAFGVVVWRERTATGWRKRYRVRGTGPVYEFFCGWMEKHPTAGDDIMDWPWSYFSFADPNHDLELAKDFASYITMGEDDARPYIEPTPPTQLETDLFADLQAAIMEEINKEIVAEITGKPVEGPSMEELKASIKERQARLQTIMYGNPEIMDMLNGKKD